MTCENDIVSYLFLQGTLENFRAKSENQAAFVHFLVVDLIQDTRAAMFIFKSLF